MSDFLTSLKSDWSSEEMSFCWKLYVFYSLLCFIVSFFANNYSQVDKLWSIVPWTYIWYYVFISNGDSRLLAMAFVSTLWGIRLTFNFARRGGYTWPPWSGEEDYRWEYVRHHPLLDAQNNPIRWQIFNLLVICFYQHFLLFAIALPAHIAYKHQNIPVGPIDFFLSCLFLFLILFEAIADQEQFDFQTEKHRKLRAGQRLDTMETDGFISSGLWSFCRHPNYFAEQALWVVLFLFTLPLEGFNWSCMGSLLLIMLFQLSSVLSENITAAKYSTYKKYQAAKPRFLPYGGSPYIPGK